MIIKIGDIVKWSGEEFVVVGNEGTNRVQLRELTDAGYDVVLDEIEEVLEEHSYGSGHVCKQDDYVEPGPTCKSSWDVWEQDKDSWDQ